MIWLVIWLITKIKFNSNKKSDVTKKTVYNKLVAKVNSVDTSRFVLKTKYDTDKTELEKKSWY